MRTFGIFIVFISFSLCLNSCKKDEGPVDNGEDLTTNVIGDYVGQLTDGIGGAFGQDHGVSVTKVNNTTVSIAPTGGSSSTSWEQIIEKDVNFAVSNLIQSPVDDPVTVTFTVNTNAMQYNNNGEFYNGTKQ